MYLCMCTYIYVYTNMYINVYMYRCVYIYIIYKFKLLNIEYPLEISWRSRCLHLASGGYNLSA